MVKMLNRPAFVSTIQVESAPGLAPVRSQARPQPTSKPKGSDVTYRHKQWLAKLQTEQSALNDMLQARADKLEETKRKLAAKATAERSAIRTINADDTLTDEQRTVMLAAVVDPKNKANDPAVAATMRSPVGVAATEGASTTYEPTSAPPPSNSNKQPPTATSSSSSSAASVVAAASAAASAAPRQWVRRARAAKPAWAQTEAESEEAQDAEADELLSFAAGLDYDRYLEDVEVREALNVRITIT